LGRIAPVGWIVVRCARKVGADILKRSTFSVPIRKPRVIVKEVEDGRSAERLDDKTLALIRKVARPWTDHLERRSVPGSEGSGIGRNDEVTARRHGNRILPGEREVDATREFGATEINRSAPMFFSSTNPKFLSSKTGLNRQLSAVGPVGLKFSLSNGQITNRRTASTE
jgi:hypothetical protein